MQWIDIVLLVLIAAALALALRSMVRNRKRRGCGDRCEGCSGCERQRR